MLKRMNLILLAALIALAGSTEANAQAVNALTKKETRKGWQLLFDGHDLSGWHTYLKQSADPVWTVEDGAIMLDHSKAQGGGDLVTNDEFENYELSIQWKISPTGNSGIIFNVHEDPKYTATYHTGLEMQVLDNEKASDNKKANHLAGSLYDLIGADPAAVHPAGEWNEVKIRMDHHKLTLWMNGKKVVKTEIGTPGWKEMVANSKFKSWGDFATYSKGHIALQDHGHPVWYRNIKIRKL